MLLPTTRSFHPSSTEGHSVLASNYNKRPGFSEKKMLCGSADDAGLAGALAITGGRFLPSPTQTILAIGSGLQHCPTVIELAGIPGTNTHIIQTVLWGADLTLWDFRPKSFCR